MNATLGICWVRDWCVTKLHEMYGPEQLGNASVWVREGARLLQGRRCEVFPGAKEVNYELRYTHSV